MPTKQAKWAVVVNWSQSVDEVAQANQSSKQQQQKREIYALENLSPTRFNSLMPTVA